MKVAVVIQRYGAAINGGAEQHARFVAEHLARHVQVEVLTTCASDYITWRNELAAGTESIHGVTVRRFPVAHERDPIEFGRISERVFTQPHAIRDELAWLEAEGPASPDLIAFIQRHAQAFDFFIFFSFRYYHAFHGARAVPDKAVLVPTAERDAALGLAIFPPIFRGVRALMYNSDEERTLIQAVADNHDVPGVVVGVGSDVPAQSHADRFRQKFNIHDRFALYIGRIDENKGCAELFTYFQRYARMRRDLHLVLVGNPIIAIPDHPRIHHAGFLSDQDKFDALAAAELLIMPSYFESLSMVALEAWAMGKPVLANGRCDVLKGQCIRSNGGLYYENLAEFVEALHALEVNPLLAGALGSKGREYFNRHYTWPVIEGKYLDMLERLSKQPHAAPMERMPGWLTRRRNDRPPADAVVATLPAGPALQVVTSGDALAAPRAAEVTLIVDRVRPPADEPSPGPAAAPPPSRAASNRQSHVGRHANQQPEPQGPPADRRQSRRAPGRFRRRPGGRPPRRPGGR